jgi:hypothetical protein
MKTFCQLAWHPHVRFVLLENGKRVSAALRGGRKASVSKGIKN